MAGKRTFRLGTIMAVCFLADMPQTDYSSVKTLLDFMTGTDIRPDEVKAVAEEVSTAIRQQLPWLESCSIYDLPRLIQERGEYHDLQPTQTQVLEGIEIIYDLQRRGLIR